MKKNIFLIHAFQIFKTFFFKKKELNQPQLYLILTFEK